MENAQQWRQVDEMIDKQAIKCRGGSVTAVLLIRDGSLLVSGSRDMSLRVWATAGMGSGQPDKGPIHSRAHLGWVGSLSYNANLGQLVSADFDRIHFWKLAEDSLRKQTIINCKEVRRKLRAYS
jgi:WD40 repeat protein